jgi:MYXO-CTERM domain-containing protein
MRSPLALAAFLSAGSLLAACADPDDVAAVDESAAIAASRYWVIDVQPGAGDALAAAGLEKVAPLPGGRALVRATGPIAAPHIAGVSRWKAWRASDRIAREIAAAEPGPEGRVPVMVHVAPGGDLAGVVAALEAGGHEVVNAGPAGEWSRVVARLEPAAVADATALLAGLDDVFYVEKIRRVGLLNDKLVGSTQSGVQGNGVAQTPIWSRGIRGQGQVVGIIDTGTDANSCYLDGATLPVTNTYNVRGGYGTAVGTDHRKIVAYDFLFSCDQYPGAAGCDTPSDVTDWDNHGHGTHIAGTILGDSDENPATYAAQDGLAPAAKLVMQDAGYRADDCADLPGLGCPMIDLGPIYAQSYAQGARAVNNSWGDNENAPPPAQSNYTARTQDSDRFMWEHPDYLIVFAAGNYGGGNREFSVGSPATLKNGLSVGSTRRQPTSTTDENISSFSSRGWTGDGRVKPDLMAPGCNVSAGTDGTVGGASNCGTDSGCGTSYAAPVAVGAAALVRQYFVEGHHGGPGFAPSAALVKAALINASTGMTGTDNNGQAITPIPSNEQGWGRIQLDRALAFAGSPFETFVDDHRAPLAEGSDEVFGYAFDVAAGRDLKVTLVWTDYPGVPDQAPANPQVGNEATWAPTQLVNDLDLEVTAPGGAQYLGNVFVGGASATGGRADRRDNVEQVLVRSAAAGRVVIRVKAHEIAVSGQQFALLVTGALGDGGACTVPPVGTIEAAVQGGDVALSWSDAAALGSYEIGRAVGGCGGVFATHGTVTETSFVDVDVVPGVTYGYRVTASAVGEGQCEAARWACVEATVMATPPDAGVPDAGVDAGVPDAGVDAPVPVPDAGVDAGVDAGAPDAGVDAGAPDAGVDAGAPDAGADAGAPDAGAVDAGAVDAGLADARAADASIPAPDAGGGDDDGGDDGCGCSTGADPSSAAPLLMAAFALLRRRRRR